MFFCKLLIPCADEGFIRQHDEKYPTNKGKLDTKRSCQLYLRLMHQNFWPAYFAVVDAFFSAASKALTEFRKSLIDLQEERE